jgi:hypothetical protein
MRIGTWNLAGRWTPAHAVLLLSVKQCPSDGHDDIAGRATSGLWITVAVHGGCKSMTQSRGTDAPARGGGVMAPCNEPSQRLCEGYGR